MQLFISRNQLRRGESQAAVEPQSDVQGRALSI